MSIKTEKDMLFLKWLRENGACYPKIDWPSNKTVSGIRGAVAIESIETNEPMLEIPIKLMITPPLALSDPEIGHLLSESSDLLYGDAMLTLYIMYEIRKEEKSFYFPFLQTLPEPSSATKWSDEMVRGLQDPLMVAKIKSKKSTMRFLYMRTVQRMCTKYPDVFPEQEYSFELFRFAWETIQARAFGKRLPWSALVPFADCLNHSNVQTKYDFNVGGNGLFRLFPTGSNSYNRGSEVFNSYGRRANDNLLLDYGFSILDNEWDFVELCFQVGEIDESDFEDDSAEWTYRFSDKAHLLHR